MRELILPRRTLVGSSDQVDMRVSVSTVSRIHAELTLQPDGLWVRDLESRNGTFVNGLRVGLARVPAGATLRFGTADVFVGDGDEVAETVDISSRSELGALLGQSTTMRNLFAQIEKVAASNASVLIRGETGTGKELVAAAIHDCSPRAGGPFVVVDCGALPENLLEAELFGTARGAFTGAVSARAGAIESAEGGTVFLDEIGELPIAMQPKLLRAVEAHSIRRIGETQHRHIDVRFLSATHRDLLGMVSGGTFREDLYFRLGVLPVEVPPLRERKDDIPLLLNRFCERRGIPPFPPNVLAELRQRSWNGNVRELRNFVERAAALGPLEALMLTSTETPSDRIDALPQPHTADASSERESVTPSIDDTRPLPPTTAAQLEEYYRLPYRDFRASCLATLEREYAARAIERNNGNVAAAAREVGLARTYMYRLLRKP